MKRAELAMRVASGLIALMSSLAVVAQGEFIENFVGTSVDTSVWTECFDLYDDGTGYDWHPVTSPGDWTVSSRSLVKDTGYASRLKAVFTPITFTAEPTIYFKVGVKSLSSINTEISVGQEGNKSITIYLNANLGWEASFPPDGTGYLLLPFFVGGPSGEARPVDDWFDVVVEINKTTGTVSLSVDGDLKCSAVEVGWLSDLTKIDTLTITVGDVDVSNPWYFDYIQVTPDPGPPAMLCGDRGTIYLDADISGPSGTKDCHVDLHDFALFAAQWLDVFVPQPPTTFTNSGHTNWSGNEGVTWFDYNNDGYVDVHVQNSLFRNNSGNSFTEMFYSTHYLVAAADYDNDGYVDMLSNGWGLAPRVMHNNSGASFSDIVPSFPSVEADPYRRTGCWGDFDNDGYVDIYLTGEEIMDGSYIFFPDRIFHNNSGSSFAVSWEESSGFRPGRGVTACDFDEDHDIDIYVSNYRLTNNRLWLNNGTGSFDEAASTYGVLGGAGHSIGSCWGDMDNDGHIDLFVVNFAHSGQPESQFLRNKGPAGSYRFENKSSTANLAYQESYCSATLGDYDNDGDLDLYLVVDSADDHPVLYRNDGDWKFTDVTAEAGLGSVGRTWQGAWADYDDDGDLDLLTGGVLYSNDGNDYHWLKVRLQGDGSAVNRSAIGAQVRIDIGQGRILTRQVEAGTGFANQNDSTLHFGLAGYHNPVNLEILWPDGTAEVVNSVVVDQTIDINYQ